MPAIPARMKKVGPVDAARPSLGRKRNDDGVGPLQIVRMFPITICIDSKVPRTVEGDPFGSCQHRSRIPVAKLISRVSRLRHVCLVEATSDPASGNALARQRSMRILVTGGAGYIGSVITDELID